MELVKAILIIHWVLVRTLQRIAGKYVSFLISSPRSKAVHTRDAGVDIIVNNQAVVFAWNNQRFEVTIGARQLKYCSSLQWN